MTRTRLSTERLASIVRLKREERGLTQEQLGELTGINRVMIGRVEQQKYIPSIVQIESLSESLGFSVADLFSEVKPQDSFIALRSEAVTEAEREGVEKLFSMMLSLRQQVILRSKHKNATHS